MKKENPEAIKTKEIKVLLQKNPNSNQDQEVAEEKIEDHNHPKKIQSNTLYKATVKKPNQTPEEYIEYQVIIENQDGIENYLKKQTPGSIIYKNVIYFVAFFAFGFFLSKDIIETNDKASADMLGNILPTPSTIVLIGVILLFIYFLQIIRISSHYDWFFESIDEYLDFFLRFCATGCGLLLAGIYYLESDKYFTGFIFLIFLSLFLIFRKSAINCLKKRHLAHDLKSP